MPRAIAISLLASLFAAPTSFAAALDADGAVIGRLLHGMFDKPNAVLTVEPIVVASDHAIADWTQGPMGGRALLRRKPEGWTLILCAGDGIRSKQALAKAGVPLADAQQLEDDLLAAEAKLPPEQMAAFSRFEGLVRMDQEGADGKSHH